MYKLITELFSVSCSISKAERSETVRLEKHKFLTMFPTAVEARL